MHAVCRTAGQPTCNGGNRRAVRQSGRARHDAYQQSGHARCVCVLAWRVASVISQVCLCSRSPARAVRFSWRRHRRLSRGDNGILRRGCSAATRVGNQSETSSKNRRLREKSPSRSRVVCATPAQKRVGTGGSARFLCCVCMHGRSVIVFVRRRGNPEVVPCSSRVAYVPRVQRVCPKAR
jgi:hypothetical protein